MSKYNYVTNKYGQKKLTSQTRLKSLCVECELVFNAGITVDQIQIVPKHNLRFSLDRNCICDVCKGYSRDKKREVPTIVDYYGALINKNNIVHVDERVGRKSEPIIYGNSPEAWDELIYNDITILLDKLEAFKDNVFENEESPLNLYDPDVYKKFEKITEYKSFSFSLNAPTYKRNLKFLYVKAEDFRKLNLTPSDYWSAIPASGVFSILAFVPTSETK